MEPGQQAEAEMLGKAFTVGFDGIEARLVEVQCALTSGMPSFTVVGLPDKAVAEARERVRATLSSLAIALPPRRVTINLAPADLPKEGSHLDLAIALALLVALEILPAETVEQVVALGELALDGRLLAVTGALPAALAAAEEDRALICPLACSAEAAWIGAAPVHGARGLAEVIAHLTRATPLPRASPGEQPLPPRGADLREVRGHERARRALEIAAAGRHHLLMVGAPGAGKTMLARCLPGLLPPMTPAEALETSMIHSLAGRLGSGGISRARPFMDPHHGASRAAVIGGGARAAPGQISLAHNGVLFLDELPEFPRHVLEALRQPLESGEVLVARAQAHVRYPCRFLLVAAANPCRCGEIANAAKACARTHKCGGEYLGKISGPMMDRFDLRIEVPPVEMQDLDGLPRGEPSATVAARVAEARARQAERFADHPGCRLNADADGSLLQEIAAPDAAARALLQRVAERFGLSARGYHRVLRVARTIADLDGAETVGAAQVAEAVSFRIVGQRDG